MVFHRIAVVGSSNTDMVIKTTKLPVPGETILGGTFFMNPGGKGANQAVAAARLGGKVSFIGKTGDDVFGKQARQLFEIENINTDYLLTDPDHPSGVALITVDAKGENCIVVAPGSNSYLFQSDIDLARKEILRSDIILMQHEIPVKTVGYVANIAFEAGKKVILNPAPALQISDELLSKLYLITPNETEAELISGIPVKDIDSATLAARNLYERGVKVVIITLGSKGALLFTGEEAKLIPSPKVEAVDTTAAGDVFNGAIAVAISEGLELEKAVEFACKAAAISVTRMGAQVSAPYRKEIK
ncbi:MAG: ribokinase [Bacteroidia bacterium]|nr:ribokinase [Bacteroidia bacterium]